MKHQLLRQSSHLVVSLSIGLFLISCTTAEKPIDVSEGTPILIDSKAQIKNAKESHNVKIDIALDPQKRIRLEVTGTLSVKVASVLMTPQKIQYALHTNQTYAEGPFAAKTLTPIFNQPLDPRLLWRIIHGEAPQLSELTCTMDGEQRPISCVGPKSMTIRWSYESNKKRRIELKASPFEMIWLFKDQKIIDTSQSETFVLKKPEGYKEIFIK